MVGMVEMPSGDVLSKFMVPQNKDIFSDSDTVLPVDVEAYHQALKSGKIIEGYGSCLVFDAVNNIRCVTIPLENEKVRQHDVIGLNSHSLKCVNCCDMIGVVSGFDFPCWMG
ncbi:hypothetical protein FQR65_LT00499 [Abscondita terminalis]|nr:hypothetical protein FQR65_LT00499 [Abscondita terminalis]